MGYATIAVGLGLGGGKAATSNGRSNVASESFTTATLSATDSNAFSVNNTYTLTIRPSAAIAAGGSISIVGLTGSTTGDNGSLTVAGTNASVFGSSGAWTQSSGTLVLTVAGGQSIPTGSDTVITFVIANPNSVTAGVSSVTLTSSGFSASSLTGTFLNAVAIFNVTTRDTEANILASTPTNPTDEVNIAFGTDTGDFYIYNGSAWYIYNDTPFNSYSISLDGTDDYLDIDGVSSTIAASDDFTISAWAKNDGGYGYIFRCSEAADSTSYKETIGLGIFSNKTYGLLQTGGSFIEYADSGGTTVNDNAWHHFALTISEASGTSTLKLYVDGSLAGSSSLAITIPNTISVASVGRRPYNSSGNGDLYFGGLIDEVGIFNSALSASDVTAIYNSGVPDDISSLNPVGWWRMGDGTEAGSGTTVYDMSSNSNNGTLTNGATFSTTVPS